MKNGRIIRQGILTGVVLGFLILLFSLPWTRGLGDSFDFLVFSLQEKAPREDIVIVALDDETLNKGGFKRFQDIDRSDYARVVDYILQGDPEVVGVDTFFFNESEDPADDQALKEVFSQTNKVVVAEEFDDESGQFLEPSAALGLGGWDKGYADLSSHTLANKGPVTFARMILDLKRKNQEIPHEPLAMKMLRKTFSGSHNARYDEARNIYEMVMGSQLYQVPLTSQKGVNINYYGKPDSYPTYSFYDIWESAGKNDAEQGSSIFKDKVVFIGATATDIHDLHYTPTSGINRMPGVEIHAHLFQTLADKDFMKYFAGWQKIFLMILFVVGSFVCGVYLSFRKALLCVGGSLLFLGVFVWQAFVSSNVVATFFWPFVGGVLTYLVLYVEKYLFAEKEKSWIKEAFGRYLSPVIVQKLSDDPHGISLEGEARDITLWFSDIVGFTTVSEGLSSQQVVSLLNTYHQEAASLLLRDGATIDKYLGDGTMAFWGAPLSIEDHAVKACASALAHKKCLESANIKLREQGLPAIDVCIGLHTASVNVGNIGTKDRMEYTAIGSGVNISSRIEGLNRVYGTNILISEDTYKQVESYVVAREIDTVQVKGSHKPMVLYELLGLKEDQTVEMEYKQQIYAQGLLAYRSRYWGTAKAHFYKLKDDKAARTMAARSEYFETHEPEEGWDGVWKMTSK